MFPVEIFLSGMTSGYLVEAHIMVRIYLFPDLVLGSGPTQSIMIRLKGFSTMGMGLRGATGIP